MSPQGLLYSRSYDLRLGYVRLRCTHTPKRMTQWIHNTASLKTFWRRGRGGVALIDNYCAVYNHLTPCELLRIVCSGRNYPKERIRLKNDGKYGINRNKSLRSVCFFYGLAKNKFFFALSARWVNPRSADCYCRCGQDKESSITPSCSGDVS